MHLSHLALVSAFMSALIIGGGCSTTPQSEEKMMALASSSTAALDAFRADDASLQALLDRSVGWAILPEVGKAGFVVGGSYGRGEVFERGVKIGYTDIKQGTFGLQIGAQTFSELVIFMRESDLANFKKGDFSLAANVSAVAIKPGVAGTTDTSKGVVVFVRTSGGLMAEASVGGQVFTFEPL